LRSTVILTLFVLACACGNGEPEGEVTEPGLPGATSADGGLTLRIAQMLQEPSSPDSELYVLSLDAELVDPPESVYLIDHAPVEKALTPDGENLGVQEHTAVVEPRDRRVSIHRWSIGPARERIETLELRLMVVRVTKWNEWIHEGLGPGESAPLRIGLFGARVAGDADRLTVTLEPEPEFDEEHKAYRKKLPLSLHSPRFSLGLLTVTDAEGRALEHVGEGGDFAFFGLPGEDGEPAKIAYPVTLKCRIPNEFETKEEAFIFTGLKLPPPVNPK